MDLWHEFHGPNAGYILELYDRYRRDPQSVDPATRAAFEKWQPPDITNGHVAAIQANTPEADKVMGAVNLATTIREYGHLAARIDPLGMSNPPGDPGLHPNAHGIDDADLAALPASIIGGPPATGAANAREAIRRLN
ncbi:MAG TPA: 2-oxoglutarate dehydrogenase E1 component, partial [Promineifilum sp.]|nr:2-oxoglutarate dehydrogenase E1 component [Promineifilum sp.]